MVISLNKFLYLNYFLGKGFLYIRIVKFIYVKRVVGIVLLLIVKYNR